MKWILLSTILILTLSGTGMVLLAPYHIYTLTLTDGINSRFLNLLPTRNELYDGSEFKSLQTDQIKNLNDGIFRKIHLSNFEVYLPIDNPAISFIPEIKLESNVHKVGFEFLDLKNNFLFKFLIEKPFKFTSSHGDQKLFLLPVYQHYIQKKDEQEMWKDIFQRKLSLPSNSGKPFIDSFVELRNIKYEELVYNLYILHNRHKFFTKDILKIGYSSELNFGVASVESESKKSFTERVFVIENGVVYPVTITTNTASLIGQSIRTIFLKNLKLKHSKAESAISLSSESRRFSFQNRTDQKGMIYLFAAWSHDFKNKEFLTVIINFLERGKENLKYLKPFYEFAYKQFGTSLSGDKKFQLETAEERLKRLSQEELDQEIKEASIKANSHDKITDNPEELIDLNLKKAKEQKIDSDEKFKNLSIE